MDEELVKRLENAYCGEFEHTERAQRLKAEVKRLQEQVAGAAPLRPLHGNVGVSADATKQRVRAF